MKAKQDNMAGFYEQAKAEAKAEKELQIETWSYVSIEYRNKTYERVILKEYYLPREIADRYYWVFRWRCARFQCEFPRELVTIFTHIYKKREGLTGYSEDLKKIAAAKAQITRVKNNIEKYILFQRQNNLFFDEATDPELRKARIKLSTKEENYNQAMIRMEKKIKEQKKDLDMDTKNSKTKSITI